MAQHQAGDTIFALSSGALPAGVAVLRLSGPDAAPIAAALMPSLPSPRMAMLRSIKRPNTAELIDSAVIIYFPGPASFTGEDVVEMHLHGSIAVVAAVQHELLHLGARPAHAGEFTRRAFSHGRLDLTQAEALSDLLAAETELQREQAMVNAGGRLRDQAYLWRQRLLHMMADIEADLDFADEPDVATTGSAPQMAALAAEISAALAGSAIAERVRHGLTIAVVGAPNRGKSSIVNRLAGRDVAIVTPHAGTTRDVIEVHLDLGGRAAVLLDTAGLRDTADPVEAEGVARARARAASADLVLDLGPSPQQNVVNRIDESGVTPGVRNGMIHISATTGAGFTELEQWLIDWAAARIPPHEPPLVTSARQADVLGRVAEALTAPPADALLQAEALREAAYHLGCLTGHIDPEQVLGAIFARFCIGK